MNLMLDACDSSVMMLAFGNNLNRERLKWCDRFDNITQNGRKKEGNVLFNDALNTFYLRLYGIGHMVKDHSDRERRNLLLPHRLRFSISSKGSFICIIP